jgi:hypothetical protein
LVRVLRRFDIDNAKAGSASECRGATSQRRSPHTFESTGSLRSASTEAYSGGLNPIEGKPRLRGLAMAAPDEFAVTKAFAQRRDHHARDFRTAE